MRLSIRHWQGSCPEWIQQYGTMHRADAGDTTAKFLMHSCGDTSYRYCAGVGDRIRAMMETVRWRMDPDILYYGHSNNSYLA